MNGVAGRGVLDGLRDRLRSAVVWPSPLSSFPRTATYEAAVRGVLIVLTGLHLVVVAASSTDVAGWPVVIGVLLLGALLTAGRRSTRHAGLGLLLVSFCLTPLADIPTASTLPSLAVGLACAVFVSQFRTIPSLVGLTIWFSCFVVVYLLSPQSSDVASLIDHAVLNLGVVTALSLIQTMLIRKLTALDRVRSEAFELTVADHLRTDALRARDAARRVLHDQVLFVLVRIADSGQWEPTAVRRLIERFHQPRGLDTDPPGVDLVDLIASAAPADLDLIVSGPPGRDRPHRLDHRTAAAVNRALGEVLRNTLRHGSGDRTLRVDHEHGQWQVTVTNASPGTEAPEPGWGWHNSVAREMAAIDGSASLTRIGDAVQATLTWPLSPRAQVDPHRDAVRLSRTEVRILTRAAWPAMLAHTFLALHHTPQPQLGVQCVVIVTLWAALWWLTRVLAARDLNGAEVMVLGAVICGCVTVSLTVAGPQSLTSYASWALGLASIPLCVAAFFGSLPRVAFLSLSLVTPVALILLTHPEVTWASASGALLTVVIPWLGHTCGQLLSRVQVAADRDEAAVRERLAAISDRQAQEHAHDLLSFTRRSIVPFLERTLETGVADTAVARRLALQMRDELNAPGLLDDALRDRLAAARVRGAEIVIHPVVEVDPDHSAMLLRALDRLLDAAGDPDRVTVRLNAPPRASSISLVAPTAESRMELIGATLGSAPVRLDRDTYAVTLVLEVVPSPDRGMDASITAR